MYVCRGDEEGRRPAERERGERRCLYSFGRKEIERAGFTEHSLNINDQRAIENTQKDEREREREREQKKGQGGDWGKEEREKKRWKMHKTRI